LLFRWPCGGGAWCRPLAAFCFALRRRVCPQTAGGPHPRPLPSRHAMVCRPRLLVWARSRIRAPGSRRGREPQVVCLRRRRRRPAAWLFAPCAGLPGAAAGLGAVALRAPGSRQGREPQGARGWGWGCAARSSRPARRRWTGCGLGGRPAADCTGGAGLGSRAGGGLRAARRHPAGAFVLSVPCRLHGGGAPAFLIHDDRYRALL
jgi:hypothetical protein